MIEPLFDPPPPDALGLIVLQADVTIEDELRRLLPAERSLLVSRVPSGADVTLETLAAMEADLTRAASLFPHGRRFDAIGYGCTSGASVIGSERVARRIRAGTSVRTVHDPLSALVDACRARGVKRLGLVTPYTVEVTDSLRAALLGQGVRCEPVIAFGVAEEAMVARIDAPTVIAAARSVRDDTVDAVFLSCTNLRTVGALRALATEDGPPVWSSNLVLAAAMAGRSADPLGLFKAMT